MRAPSIIPSVGAIGKITHDHLDRHSFLHLCRGLFPFLFMVKILLKNSRSRHSSPAAAGQPRLTLFSLHCNILL